MEANHNPTVVVDGEPGKGVVRIKARPSAAMKLSADGTADPDGHKLRYHWFAYPEAGTSRVQVELTGERDLKSTATVNRPAMGPTRGKVHVILAVEDDGEPSLTAYRRVILDLDDRK